MTVFKPETAEALDRLVSRTGVIGATLELPVPEGDPRFHIWAASTGNMAAVLPGVRKSTGGQSTRGTIDGAGGSSDSARARLLGIAEGLERYASCSYSEDQFVWASALELGPDAIDLASLPSHSESEIAATPSLSAPDPRAPQRWVKAVSLMNGRVRWIPAMLVYLHLPYASAGERMTVPISTGCALHSDPLQALANALYEDIERDSIAMTWLQQIRWPRLELPPLAHNEELRVALTPNPNVQWHLFDATTDLGIPTIYGIEITPRHERVHTVVAAVTSWDFESALAKLLREVASCRIALRNRTTEGRSPDEFVAVHDGATYMAHRSRTGAFSFLLEDAAPRGPRQHVRQLAPATGAAGQVRWLLEALADKGMDAFAVNLTSREVADAGLFCCKVVVPELVPLSFVKRAQFRGTPRLYRAPEAMGYRSRTEADLNPWPQPFA